MKLTANNASEQKGKMMNAVRPKQAKHIIRQYVLAGGAVMALLLLVFSPDEVKAQGTCTGAPGEMVVGMAGGGPGGYQTPLCSSSSGSGGAPRKSESELRNDQISTAYATDITMMTFGLTQMLQQIERRQNGFWETYGPERTVERGFRSCSAVYLQGNHYLMIWGSNKPGSQATLMLMDTNKDAAMRPIEVPEIQQVTLAQTGAQPATVNAIRHSFEGYGAITFAIPSLELAVSGLQDKMNIKVNSGAQTLIEMNYNKGKSAKFWLENCVKKLPRVSAR